MRQSLAWQPDLFTQTSNACFSNSSIYSGNNVYSRGNTNNNCGSNNIHSGNIDNASRLQR